jgi:hypothetical protein
MYFLKKAHIGETQVSVWPEPMLDACRRPGSRSSDRPIPATCSFRKNGMT